MKKLTKKKKDLGKSQGNFADILGTSLCLFFMLVVLITVVRFYRMLELKRQVDSLARDYILTLEEKGELTSSDLAQLNDTLSKAGFYNCEIVFNETNVKVNHGKEVSLKITVHTNIQLGVIGSDNAKTITTELFSTSKS